MGRKSNMADNQPLSPQVIGHAFVQQYYHILRHSPDIAHRFYKETSKLTRPENDGTMSVTTTVKGIGAKIVSLNYGDFKAEIKSVDAQESLMGAVDILVTGYMTGKDNTVRFFVQSFFLEPQDNGYYVLIDMLRFEDLASANPVVVADVLVAEPEVVLPAAEPLTSAPIQKNHVSKQSTPAAEEAVTGEVYSPPENGVVPVVEIAEVSVDEVQDDTQLIVESITKIEDVPKKSYASIGNQVSVQSAPVAKEVVGDKEVPMAEVVDEVLDAM